MQQVQRSSAEATFLVVGATDPYGNPYNTLPSFPHTNNLLSYPFNESYSPLVPSTATTSPYHPPNSRHQLSSPQQPYPYSYDTLDNTSFFDPSSHQYSQQYSSSASASSSYSSPFTPTGHFSLAPRNHPFISSLSSPSAPPSPHDTDSTDLLSFLIQQSVQCAHTNMRSPETFAHTNHAIPYIPQISPPYPAYTLPSTSNLSSYSLHSHGLIPPVRNRAKESQKSTIPYCRIGVTAFVSKLYGILERPEDFGDCIRWIQNSYNTDGKVRVVGKGFIVDVGESAIKVVPEIDYA